VPVKIAEADKEKENRMKMPLLTITHHTSKIQMDNVFAISPLMSALSTPTQRHRDRRKLGPQRHGQTARRNQANRTSPQEEVTGLNTASKAQSTT